MSCHACLGTGSCPLCGEGQDLGPLALLSEADLESFGREMLTAHKANIEASYRNPRVNGAYMAIRDHFEYLVCVTRGEKLHTSIN